LRQKVFGVGWDILPNGQTGMSFQAYEIEAKEKYEESQWQKHLRFLLELQIGDFLWIRDKKGEFYLGTIDGPWKYIAEGENMRANLFNVRGCAWRGPFKATDVPGELHEARGLYKRIKGPQPYAELLRCSRLLYEPGSNYAILPDADAIRDDLFMYLSPNTCEDLVGLYLQNERGYSMIPTTCKQSSKRFEFRLIHRTSGEPAAAQVKKGKSCIINLSEYKDDGIQVFVFLHGGHYEGDLPENVEVISESTLTKFADDNRAFLPGTIKNWLDLTNPEKSK